MQAISWVWCICFTVKNEQNWERDFINTYYFLYVLMKHHLEETESDDLRKKMEREERERRERALRHKAPVSRDSRQAFTCVFPTVCVCVCVCARVSAAYWCASRAQDEGGGERENVLPEAVSPRLFCAHEERTQRVIFLILHQIMSKINLFL